MVVTSDRRGEGGIGVDSEVPGRGGAIELLQSAAGLARTQTDPLSTGAYTEQVL
jgi:hypothetical protein